MRHRDKAALVIFIFANCHLGQFHRLTYVGGINSYISSAFEAKHISERRVVDLICFVLIHDASRNIQKDVAVRWMLTEGVRDVSLGYIQSKLSQIVLIGENQIAHVSGWVGGLAQRSILISGVNDVQFRKYVDMTGHRMPVIYQAEINEQSSVLHGLKQIFVWAGAFYPDPWSLFLTKIIDSDSVCIKCSISTLSRLPSLPQAKTRDDKNAKESSDFQRKSFMLASIVLLAGGSIFFYKVWWKISFDFTRDMNLPRNMSLMGVAAIAIIAGVWLAADAFWGSTHL